MHLFTHPFISRLVKQRVPSRHLVGASRDPETRGHSAWSPGESQPRVPVGNPLAVLGRPRAGTGAELLRPGLAEEASSRQRGPRPAQLWLEAWLKHSFIHSFVANAEDLLCAGAGGAGDRPCQGQGQLRAWLPPQRLCSPGLGWGQRPPFPGARGGGSPHT